MSATGSSSSVSTNSPVVERAREVLSELEAGETSGKASRLADDLPLFSAAVRREPAPRASREDDAARPLVDALAALHPDEMTPREALEAVYRLKGMIP